MRIVRVWLESGKQGPQQRRKGRMTWNWGLRERGRRRMKPQNLLRYGTQCGVDVE